jgi:ATP-binding cassette subfamily B protein
MTPTRFALAYARRQWRGMSVLSAIMVVEVALSALTPWPMKWLIDDLLAPTHRPHLILFCVSATVALFAAGAVLSLVQTTVSIGVGQGLTYAVSSDLFAHLQRLSLRFHARRSVGDSIRRVTSDCGCVTTLVRDCGLPMVASALTLLVMASVSFWLSWQLTLVSILLMPLMVPLFLRLGGPIADRAYAYGEAEGRGYELIERVLSAIPVMQAFGRERANDQSLAASYDATLAAALSANGAQMKLRAATGLVTAIGSAAVLYVGATQVMSGALSVGSLLVFLAYLASVYSPLESIVDGGRHVLDAAGSTRRVIEVFDLDQDVTDAPDAAPLAGRRGEVVFEDVTFGYDPDRPVLSGLSLHVRPGEVVALVGGSGAGKTTLVSLLPRLYDPWAGRVLIDGQDVRTVQLASLRRHVGLVLQQPFLFPISVAENIAYGRPGASRDEVERAARAAAAHDFIGQLPDGYDTVVGDRGGTLSVGQRQRISIARALLLDPPLLVLDEPTSALDAETESTVVDALRAAGGSRTTIVIAHKLSTVRAADRIAVLAGGAIVAVGPHERLLSESSHYAELCRRQLGGAA